MVSTLQTIQNLVWWVHNINIRLTLPVVHFGQGWVLYRLFRILQGEYTTWILDLLYKLLIMDKGEYSTDYSESCKVSGLNTILKYSTSCSLWSKVSTLLTLRISSCCVLYIQGLFYSLSKSKRLKIHVKFSFWCWFCAHCLGNSKQFHIQS